jgi:hypothetical protein
MKLWLQFWASVLITVVTFYTDKPLIKLAASDTTDTSNHRAKSLELLIAGERQGLPIHEY